VRVVGSGFVKKWKYGTLEDAVIKGSSNISLNKIKEDKGEYAFYGAKGFIKNISFYHQEKEYLAIIKDGAGIGRVSQHPPKSSVIATMQYLIPKENFHIRFVKYFLHGIDFEKHRNGSTIPHIYFKDYKSEPFPLLNLQEQEKIVAILDETFSAIEKVKTNTELNLQNAKELFESSLQNMFENRGEGWEEKSLDNLSKKIFAGGDAPKNNFSKTQTNLYNIPIYANAVKNNGLYGFTNNARVTESSITIAARGSGTGHTMIREKDFFPIVRLIVLTPDTNLINLKFFKYAINTLDILKSGSAIPQLTVPMIKAYKIFFPPLKEQQKIVKKLDTLSEQTKKLESIYTQKLTDLEELKKSLLQKAFSGKLV